MRDKLPPAREAPLIEPAAWAAMSKPADNTVTGQEIAALVRLLEIGRGNTGQSRRVADFLLAWWNAGQCGSFDLTTLWSVDTSIAADMVTVFALIGRVHRYPDAFGYEEEFKAVVREWRPELAGE